MMDRDDRQRKLHKLRVWASIGGLAGLALFSGLAAAGTYAAGSKSVSPDQQVRRLENSNGGSFFSPGADQGPSSSSDTPQTSSGGS